MAMAVVITNITDAPESKKTPKRLAIYTAHLDPGESLKLPATHVDARLRDLEKQGYIAIGRLPSWYAASKAKKLGRRTLTTAQLEEGFAKRKAAQDSAKSPMKKSAPFKALDSSFDPTDKKKDKKAADDIATEDKKNDKK